MSAKILHFTRFPRVSTEWVIQERELAKAQRRAALRGILDTAPGADSYYLFAQARCMVALYYALPMASFNAG